MIPQLGIVGYSEKDTNMRRIQHEALLLLMFLIRARFDLHQPI